MGTLGSLSARVRTAHGDAWQEQGHLRTRHGGGASELPGIRVMASGLAHPQWNNGDVTDSSLVEIDRVREWYAERGVPWGVRVPTGEAWSWGRLLFRKRLMGLTPARFVPAMAVPGSPSPPRPRLISRTCLAWTARPSTVSRSSSASGSSRTWSRSG